MPLFQMTGGLGLKTYGSHVTGRYWSIIDTTINLTPNGARGSLGPSSVSYPTGYPSVSLLNGVQRVTFPFDCMIEADVMGANGQGYNYNSYGGRGRGMRINFKYQAGQSLMCLVGQGGARGPSGGNGGGGGGGSYLWEGSVVAGSASADLLAIGGGGGGSGSWYMCGGNGCRYTTYNSNTTYGNLPFNYYGTSYNRTFASNPSNTYGGNHGPYTQENGYSSWNQYWNGPAPGGAGWNSNDTNMRGKDIRTDSGITYYTYYSAGGGARDGYGIVGGVRYFSSTSSVYRGRAISNTYTNQGGFGGGGAAGGNGLSGGGGSGYTGGNGGGNWQGGGTNGRHGHGAGHGGTSYVRSGTFNGVTLSNSTTILGTNSGSVYSSASDSSGGDGYITLKLYDVPAGGTKMLAWV